MKKTYYEKNILRNAMTYENNKDKEVILDDEVFRAFLMEMPWNRDVF